MLAPRRLAYRPDPTKRWSGLAGAIPGDTHPYLMPSAAPWNAPLPALTPNVHGGVQAMHPSVVDFNATPWNGYRFWMAQTPMSGGNVALENPVIMGSHDGFTWEEPPGISNPIAPPPPGGANSDTELVYDPDRDRLICYWRPHSNWGRIVASWSHDGVTWAPMVTVVPTFQPAVRMMSPTVLRRGPGDWWMFATASDLLGHVVYRTADPLNYGPPSYFRLDRGSSWHSGVAWDGEQFLMIGQGTADLALWSSRDGYRWSNARTGVMVARPGEWDGSSLYRPHLTIRDAKWADIWYSAHLNQHWRVGHTRLPRSLWPAPPA